MLDIEKLNLIKLGNLILCGFDPMDNSGFYEFSLKNNSYLYCNFIFMNNRVYLDYRGPKYCYSKLTSEQQYLLHKKYPKLKRIRKSIDEYVQRFSLINVRNRKLRILLNEY
jgi:hypothetical protein